MTDIQPRTTQAPNNAATDSTPTAPVRLYNWISTEFDRRMKSFGIYIFNVGLVCSLVFQLENLIKTCESFLKKLLLVVNPKERVVYQCHKCLFRALDGKLRGADAFSPVTNAKAIETPEDKTCVASDNKEANSSEKEDGNNVVEEDATVEQTVNVVDDYDEEVSSELSDPECSDLEDEEKLAIKTIHQHTPHNLHFLEKIFSFSYKLLILFPTNTFVAFLHFWRNGIFDFHDYCRKVDLTTSSGRRIVTPHRNIKCRLLLRLQKLKDEIINLAAVGEQCKLILIETGELLVDQCQSTTRKRKITLDELDLASDEENDPDYVPEDSEDELSECSSEEDLTEEIAMKHETQLIEADQATVKATASGLKKSDDSKDDKASNSQSAMAKGVKLSDGPVKKEVQLKH
ncbi:uncharacterized protein LOC115220516 [Argonauta hians]